MKTDKSKNANFVFEIIFHENGKLVSKRCNKLNQVEKVHNPEANEPGVMRIYGNLK